MAGRSYARGRWAVGECRRSGRKMLLRDMVADGYYPNLIVDPTWYEPKHPQESLPALEDPVALFRPAPQQDKIGGSVNILTGGVGQALGGSGQDFFIGFALDSVSIEIVPPTIPTLWFSDDFSSYVNGELLGE